MRYTERYSFGTLWNGVSVAINPRDITQLARLPGVKAIYPVVKFSPPERSTNPGIELVTAIKQTGADIAQNTLGLTGAGIKVGGDGHRHRLRSSGSRRLLRPGLPRVHRLGLRRRRLQRRRYFADLQPDHRRPTRFPTTATATARTSPASSAPNGAIRGVAPGVKFGAYRVFGCNGSTTSEIMIAAMERAYVDGMDILNMSIGAAFQWPQYPTAVAASRLVNKGMVVVASIGNSGASGLYSASAPGLGKNVIGVASFDNTHVLLPAFTVTPDGQKIGYTQRHGCSRGADQRLVRDGADRNGRFGGRWLHGDRRTGAGSLTGKVALIRRGTCGFAEKAANAQAAGAAGVVLYNNAAGFINPTVAGPVVITIPVVAITAAEGALIDSRLAAGAVDDDVDRAAGEPAESDGEPDLFVQLLRPRARPVTQA